MLWSVNIHVAFTSPSLQLLQCLRREKERLVAYSWVGANFAAHQQDWRESTKASKPVSQHGFWWPNQPNKRPSCFPNNCQVYPLCPTPAGGCSICSQAKHVSNASNPSAHHLAPPIWDTSTKAEGFQACFCWVSVSFTASGNNLLANTYPVSEALTLSSDSRFFCWSRVLQTLCPWARDFGLLSHLKFFKLLIVYEEPVFGCMQQKGYSAWGMNETQLSRTFLGERGEISLWHKRQTDLCSFISWEFRKSANSAVLEMPSIYWPRYLCLAWKSWQISQPIRALQRRPGLLILWIDFHDMYVLTSWLTFSFFFFFAVTLILMWNNPWTMHTHFEWTQTMPQLRSNCSTSCSQVTHCSWLFASQESDRWKYIIRNFAVVAIVKFFTLLNTLLENSDWLWHLILFRSQLMTATSNLR